MEQLWIRNEVEDHTDYRPEGISDMGWLGYFVGRHEHLKYLHIKGNFVPTLDASISDVLEPFFQGMSRNKSIGELNFEGVDLLGGRVFTTLDLFFKVNRNLTSINIDECNFGEEGCRLFALALGSSTESSMKSLCLKNNNNISAEGMVDIITSLSMHTQLERLDISEIHLNTNGCIALSTLLQNSTTLLETLRLPNIELDDKGIDALVPALKNCSCLKELKLCDNPRVTTKGWKHLASILKAPNSSLKDLTMMRNRIDDEVVVAFANALMNNRTLNMLDLENANPTITEKGFQAFSKLLCDTSSVNATFLSNHNISDIDFGSTANTTNIDSLLQINGTVNTINYVAVDKKEVATIKILKHHNNFDMLPFFEWEFKVLPLMIDWFERASSVTMPENFEPNIGPRKLSSIYQFVRGMPVEHVEAYLRKELEDIKAEESQMEEKFRQRKQFLQDRRRSIVERLGQPSTK